MPPLDGVRVIDLTRVVAGPYCTMMLGDMGAEVLKIEEPQHGDDSRGWGPFIDGWSSFFLALNRSKKSVALDLKSERGAARLPGSVRPGRTRTCRDMTPSFRARPASWT